MSSPPNTTAPPPTTTATTDYFKLAAAATRQKPKTQQPPFPPPTQQQQHRPLYPNLRTTHQPGGVSYPVASSGIDFLPKQPDNDGGFRPVSGYRAYGYSSSEHLQQTLLSGGASSAVGMITGGSGWGSASHKVPVSEGTSLYAHCRSWLKNGFTVENQPQYVDHVKSLPKPLPASVIEASKEDDTEMEENTADVGTLSAKELLQQHVKHAKKVRARLRNQRLQRIERYKDRLALLLPPVGDQQPKSDPVS